MHRWLSCTHRLGLRLADRIFDHLWCPWTVFIIIPVGWPDRVWIRHHLWVTATSWKLQQTAAENMSREEYN
jgi:hypothetical protein